MQAYELDRMIYGGRGVGAGRRSEMACDAAVAVTVHRRLVMSEV
jgi:hypothetical protein